MNVGVGDWRLGLKVQVKGVRFKVGLRFRGGLGFWGGGEGGVSPASSSLGLRVGVVKRSGFWV